MSEIEAKFLVEDQAQAARLFNFLQSYELDLQSLPTVDIIDRYLDTHDWQVFRAGWAYRWRDASGKRKIGLKSLAMAEGAIQKRDEVEQKVSRFPGNGNRIGEGPVARELKKLGDEKLHELFRIQNCRRLFNIRTPQGAVIEVAMDHAKISSHHSTNAGAGQLEFDEVELELKQGGEQALRELVGAIQELDGLLPSRMSKFERGLQVASLYPPLLSRPETRHFKESKYLKALRKRSIKKSDPILDLVYRYMTEQFREMLGQEPRAWEGLDPEGVHQMRVATRRIRAALRALGKVLPRKSTRKLGKEFKWIAAVLGDVRDLDVYRENLNGYAAEIPDEEKSLLVDYRQHLAENWQRARQQLVRSLSSERYKQLTEYFAEVLRKGPPKSTKSRVGMICIADVAQEIIGKSYRRVISDGRRIRADSRDEELHALRIDCKRLRYLFEFFYPFYGRDLNRPIKRLKRLQDLLGEFQDACLATQKLRSYAEQIPMRPENRGVLIALGQLIHSQRAEAAIRRERFPRIWKRFDRRGRRKEILALLSE